MTLDDFLKIYKPHIYQLEDFLWIVDYGFCQFPFRTFQGIYNQGIDNLNKAAFNIYTKNDNKNDN